MPAARALLFALLMAAGSAAAGNDPVLAPPAEALPPAAEAMRDELQRIVAARDLQALRAHVREDTTLSFGGDSGPQGFDAVWATDAAATRELEPGRLPALTRERGSCALAHPVLRRR